MLINPSTYGNGVGLAFEIQLREFLQQQPLKFVFLEYL
jgi:hypothetical protein